MSERTQGEWKIKGGDLWVGNKLVGMFDVLEDAEESEANLEFLVKAVNNHDRLVEALEKMLSAGNSAMGTAPEWWEILQAAIDESAQLLDEVKGK